jgi:hypothetical protein
MMGAACFLALRVSGFIQEFQISPTTVGDQEKVQAA